MTSRSGASLLARAAWCVLVPLAVVAAYLGLGVQVVSAVGEPIVGTVVLGGIVVVLGSALRLLRPRWFAYDPAPRPVSEDPRFVLVVLGCTALAFLAGQSLALWLYLTGGSDAFDRSAEARREAGSAAVLLLRLVIAPAAEEMLLRGLLYPLLRNRAGVVVSVLVAAVVFGVLHGNAVQFALVLPLAVLLGLVYERTRRLWPCVLVHLGFNIAITLVPAGVLAPLANPVSALLLTAAFTWASLLLYQRIAAREPPGRPDGGGVAEDGARST